MLDTITTAYYTIGDNINRNFHCKKLSDWEYQKEFKEFVNSCFEEENLCYRVDDQGIVHYSPDEEFNITKQTTLKILQNDRYQAVRKEFNSAYHKLDLRPADTKGAIKAIFESLETLCKLLTGAGGSSALNGDLIKTKLKPLLKDYYTKDETASKAVSSLVESFIKWVGTMHWYRHGQKIEEPNDPPLDLTVLLISTGAAFLRWLAEIDINRISTTGVLHQDK